MITQKQIEAIGNLMFERLGIGNGGSAEELTKALYFRDLLHPTMKAITFLTLANGPDKHIQPVVEVLRALADGLELVESERIRDESNSK